MSDGPWCEEFIVDAYQIYLARKYGADAILLIAAVLPNQDLKYFQKIANSLGMAALIEVHTYEEMERVLKLDDIDLLGINNRDLGTFEAGVVHRFILFYFIFIFSIHNSIIPAPRR